MKVRIIRGREEKRKEHKKCRYNTNSMKLNSSI
jgi:hypothetical protein